MIRAIPGSYAIDPDQGVSNQYANDNEDDLVAPLLWGVFGVRNSGKSHLVSKYLIHSQKRRYPLYTRCFIITPSYKSNESYWAPWITEEDAYDPTDENLGFIIGELENEAKEWGDYVKELEAYKEIVRKMRARVELSDDELVVAMAQGLLDPQEWAANRVPDPPEWKYQKIQKENAPCTALLILDDCIAGNQGLLAGKHLSRVATLNRHIAQLEEPFVSKSGEVRTSVGMSCIFLSQTYRMQVGGPARVMREQLTHATVFKNKQPKQLQAIIEELGSVVSQRRFATAYNIAVQEPYGSVTVTFKPTHPDLQFRLGLSQAIVVPETADDEIKAVASTDPSGKFN